MEIPTSIKIRPCPSYPGYSVSTDGRVFSHYKKVHRRWEIDLSVLRERRPKLDAGYHRITLVVDGRRVYKGVHALMLDAFVGPCPEGMIARHLDDNQLNNTIENLAWGLPIQNAEDRRRNGKYPTGEANPTTKLTDNDALEILNAPKFYGSTKMLAARFGVTGRTISTLLHNPNCRPHLKRSSQVAHT